MISAPKPAWLDDEPEITAWLHEALDRLDAQPASARSAPLRFPVDRKRFPGLFHLGPEADHRWELIKGLAAWLPLVFVPKKKTNPFAPEYEGGRLDLGVAAEQILRDWLHRPRTDPEMQAWQEAVDGAQADWSPEARARLRNRPIRIRGRTGEEVVMGLVRLGDLRHGNLTWRQMSSRAFFGDSKFLESREALVLMLYPDLVAAPRPILVSVTLPPDLRGVLFIENQDTYVRATEGAYPEMEGLALVFAAGFKGTAARIRERRGAVLHFGRAEADPAAFARWWTGETAQEWQVFFWGDLDFEGMRILRGLREQFGAEAWKPGYDALLSLLRRGQAHAPEAADKSNQKPPGATGCPYADTVLLPTLLTSRRFVDQEAW